MKHYVKKIKINLSYNSYYSTLKDIELFDFPNVNRFLNCLCNNYYSILLERKMNIKNYLKNLLERYIDNENKIIEISDTLNSFLNTTYNDDNYNYHLHNLYLIPTTSTRDLFNRIFLNELNSISLSVFIRNLINEYLKLTQSQREQVVHFKIFSDLNAAIADAKRVILLLADKKIYFSPFNQSVNDSDTFNYLIGKNLHSNKIESYKLSDIKTVILDDLKNDFNEEEILNMQHFIKNGIEFASEDISIVKIILSKEGIKKFNKLHLNRPFLTSKEDNVYFFKSTEQNLFEYFIPFGSDAIILEPDSIKTKFINFYENALDFYKIKATNHNES